MKLVFYFYKNILSSSLVCILSSLTIFYIFSLIGNLGEDLSFTSILFLSILNTIQIFTYIPSIIILIIIIIFMSSLRSRNELLIIKEYFSTNKIILTFLPITIFCTFIEINKDIASKGLEQLKINFLNSDNYIDTKVIINQKKDTKSYLILKGINISEAKIKEFQKYEISEDSILSGEYSNVIEFRNTNLVTNEYTLYENNEFENLTKENLIISNINKFNNKNIIIQNNYKDHLNYFYFIKIIYFSILYICLLLILFNKEIVDRKKNILFPILTSFVLLLYSILISSLDLNIFHIEMHILALILIFLAFYKAYIYE